MKSYRSNGMLRMGLGVLFVALIGLAYYFLLERAELRRETERARSDVDELMAVVEFANRTNMQVLRVTWRTHYEYWNATYPDHPQDIEARLCMIDSVITSCRVVEVEQEFREQLIRSHSLPDIHCQPQGMLEGP